MKLADILLLRKQKQSEPLSNLKVLMSLYEVSNLGDTYVNYLAGMRYIYEWLRPFELPSEDSLFYLRTNLLGSYDINEIAKLVGVHPQHLLDLSLEIYLERKELLSWQHQKNSTS